MTCSKCKEDYPVKFTNIQFKTGEVWEYKGNNSVFWVFVMSGQLLIYSDKLSGDVGEKEMFLLMAPEFVRIECTANCEMVIFETDRPLVYGASLLNRLSDMCEQPGEGRSKLQICPPLNKFLELIILYLKDGMICGSLQEEKQEELFLLLGAYYSQVELAQFLKSLSLRNENNFRKFVQMNSLKAKSVDELAKLCGCTPSVFKKMFKELFSEPVYQWMLKQKADTLRDKLAEEGINLKELVCEFGFSSPAHFTKFCKKWLGATPTQYIEELKSKREQIQL